jgi:propanediol dehydratase small subunit
MSKNINYPLSQQEELLRSITGKKVSELTFENAMEGRINYNDFKISSETLKMQADIAESNGRIQLAKNLKRAAELVNLPNELILEIYNLLRPSNCNKNKLLEIIKILEEKYEAIENAKFVREAVSIYELRGIFRKEETNE